MTASIGSQLEFFSKRTTLAMLRAHHHTWCRLETLESVEALPVPLSEQFQAQRVQLDETFRIVLVIGACIVLKGHMRLRVE